MISERDIIYISKKQASVTIASLVGFCIVVFMLGYFWGKQSVLDGFGQRVSQESAQDQVDYMATMQSFVQQSQPETSSVDSEVTSQVEKKVLDDSEVKKETKAESVKPVEVKKIKKHHAILLGFGTKASALAFVNRLKKHGISVEIRSRTSRSASGKAKKNWYQVVTKSYDSKRDLQNIVDKIKKHERIKESDIKIV